MFHFMASVYAWVYLRTSKRFQLSCNDFLKNFTTARFKWPKEEVFREYDSI